MCPCMHSVARNHHFELGLVQQGTATVGKCGLRPWCCLPNRIYHRHSGFARRFPTDLCIIAVARFFHCACRCRGAALIPALLRTHGRSVVFVCFCKWRHYFLPRSACQRHREVYSSTFELPLNISILRAMRPRASRSYCTVNPFCLLASSALLHTNLCGLFVFRPSLHNWPKYEAI